MIVEVKNDQMTPVQRAYLAAQKLGRLANINVHRGPARGYLSDVH